jgi:hypothetical protein
MTAMVEAHEAANPMQIALLGAVAVVTASQCHTCSSLSLGGGGCCELMGVEFVAMQRIPVRARMGNHCKPLTGLPDEPVTTDNCFRDMPHFCS